MTLSWPSFLAAAINAFIPPPCATEVTVAQLVLLPAVVPPLLLLEPEELHAAVSSKLPTTAALVAIRCLARTIPSQTTVPGGRGPRSQILARQVEILASQDKREVSGPWPAAVCCRSGW